MQLGKKMDEFALYPYCSRATSEHCNLGIPWSKISEDLVTPEGLTPICEQTCDFNAYDWGRCSASCGVSENTLISYIR